MRPSPASLWLPVVPLVAALLPFIGVHASYYVAASTGTVDWCFPYLDSCTSISATGRRPPASYLFRATMLPSAVVMMLYWWLSHGWLRSLQLRFGGRTSIANTFMLWLGVLACLGLIAYVTVLGEAGEAWARQRRIGTVLFFSLTYVAQLLLLAQLRSLQVFLPAVQPVLIAAMWLICMLLLLLGVMTVVLDAWNEQWYQTVEDAFEWNLTLLLQSNFLLGYFVWRQAGLRLEFTDTPR